MQTTETVLPEINTDDEHIIQLRKQVEIALESVRGYLQADGGDLKLHTVDNDSVEIEFLGACIACSMSEMTLKLGIEQAIFKSVPQIKEVKVKGKLFESEQVIE